MKSDNFEIIKNVKSGIAPIKLDIEPLRLATIIDMDKFTESGFDWIHLETVFLEDNIHDWSWSNGVLRYYSRIADVADIVVSYTKLRK